MVIFMVKTIRLFLEEVFIVAGVAIERIFRRAWYEGFTSNREKRPIIVLKTLLLIFTLGFLCRVFNRCRTFCIVFSMTVYAEQGFPADCQYIVKGTNKVWKPSLVL